ncbi:MAG: insulinase family protein [Pseudomonadales bacterium]|nr:insulinase family protein [Pseudomonadales bacterium]
MSAIASPAAHGAFREKRERRIETLGVTVHEYEHIQTGAAHYHLASAYDENVFMVAFRTVPMDSTGVAHILEHTVLCGSERYPVRDPFFWMIRRSLNTFMNAFTTSDYTAYPFASQNRKDFFNLLDVYLDAVFFSRLDPRDFAQEGCRIEFENPDDDSTPLVYRGVVFNEMKGDSSSAISVVYETLREHLYPTTTYHYNSGGDPRHIPELTYDGLKSFYSSHYHPSNAVFMTFGDVPAAEVQEKMDAALSNFARSTSHIAVTTERRLSEPLRVSAPYAIEDEEGTRGKTHIVMAWLLGENTDLAMLLRCSLLSDALLDTSASPLRQALETCPLAGAVSPLSGLEETSHEMSFMVGVEGSEAEHAEEIERLVLETLERVAEEGIAQDKLEACLHQLELSQREIGGDSAPFGLQLMFSCMSAAIHRGDPIALLDLDPVLVELREQVRDPAFVKGLVRDLLLDNPHRVTLVQYPDTELAESEAEDERQRLEAIKSSLDEAARREVVLRARDLLDRQNAEEDISVLPRVGIEDVPMDIDIPAPVTLSRPDAPRITAYRAGTNGIAYHQVITNMPALSPEAFRALPWWTSIVTEIGSGGAGYLVTQHEQHSETGGISCYATFRGETTDARKLRSFVTFSSRTLNPRFSAMTALMRRTLCAPDWDERGRVRDLVKQMRVRREGGITGNAQALAMTAAASNYSPVSHLNHELSGLAGIKRLRALDDGLSDDGELDAFIATLRSLHESILDADRQFLVVADEGFVDDAVGRLLEAWPDARWRDGGFAGEMPLPKPVPEQAWVTNTQVNFCGAAVASVPEGHPDSAVFSVLAGVLRNGFLHRVLREQGGAYGGGASHDASNGVFRFYSYRDPNLGATFDAFRSSIQWLIDSNISFDLIEEAILGLVSSIDAPGSPAGRARQAFHNELFGRDAAHRRQVRAAILRVTVDDVKRVASERLTGDMARAVVTSESAAKTLGPEFVVQVI